MPSHHLRRPCAVGGKVLRCCSPPWVPFTRRSSGHQLGGKFPVNRMVLGSEGRHTGPLTVVGVPDPPAARRRGARGSDELHALGKKLHDDPEGSALQVCSQLCSSGMEAESEIHIESRTGAGPQSESLSRSFTVSTGVQSPDFGREFRWRQRKAFQAIGQTAHQFQ